MRKVFYQLQKLPRWSTEGERDISGSGAHYINLSGNEIPSNSMGNQGAAYALSEVYGPIIAAEMVFAAEVYFAWKDTQPWLPSDAIGSFRDNGIGIGQWMADNPGYLANPLLYAAYLLSKDIKGASSCSP